jgi:hypothetical protein
VCSLTRTNIFRETRSLLDHKTIFFKIFHFLILTVIRFCVCHLLTWDGEQQVICGRKVLSRIRSDAKIGPDPENHPANFNVTRPISNPVKLL